MKNNGRIDAFELNQSISKEQFRLAYWINLNTAAAVEWDVLCSITSSMGTIHQNEEK